MNKPIYLTFDDGPTPEVTPWVLSLLKKYNFTATFFCLGKNVEKYHGLFQQIKAEGHSIGNHGYEHLNGWETATKRYIENTHKANHLIQSTLFRPPYGKITPLQWLILRKHYRIVFWDFLSKDYKASSSEKQFQKLLLKTKPCKIIVFHDTIKAFPFLEKYLESYLRWLKENNYTGINI